MAGQDACRVTLSEFQDDRVDFFGRHESRSPGMTRRTSNGSLRYHFEVSTLVRPETSDDNDLEVLRARLSGLEATLGERSGEVVRVRAELSAFRDHLPAAGRFTA